MSAPDLAAAAAETGELFQMIKHRSTDAVLFEARLSAPVTILAFDDDEDDGIIGANPFGLTAEDRAADEARGDLRVARDLVNEASRKIALIANCMAGPSAAEVAADALHAAGKLVAVETMRFDLFRLSGALRDAYEASFGPNMASLDPIADEVDKIADAIFEALEKAAGA